MNAEEYIEKIGKRIVCIKTDKTFGIVKDNAYKIISVEKKIDYEFYNIETSKMTIGFKSTSGYFMSIKDSVVKLRELKLKRVLRVE